MMIDFGVLANRRAVGQTEHKGSDHHGWKRWGSGSKVVQLPDEVALRQLDAGLLPSFSLGGLKQMPVARISSPSGERDLSRPGVAGDNGALDEQQVDAVRPGRQHHGDGRRDGVGFVNAARFLAIQVSANGAETQS